MPRKLDFLSYAWCEGNTGLEEVVFLDKTMNDVRNLYYSTTGSTKWNFGNGTRFPHQVVITCTDGQIKYVDDAWTDFPK